MLDIFQHRSWALSESFVARMLPVLSTWLVNGHSLDSLVKKKGASEYFFGIQALAAANDVKVEMQFDPELDMGLAKVNGKSIGVMSMIGSLTKYGGLCSPGMQDYQQMISKMNASDRVDGLVIIIDSPGGTVDGTPELGLAVKNSTKPIGFFGDGIVASAAYWVASQGSVIVGNKNNPTEFGSIGTLFISENWQNMIAAGNVQEFKIIRAPQSKQKALVNPIEPLTDDLENSIKDELKSITADFISTVKSGRGSALNTKLEGLFEGKMFDVNTAKANGMIDSVGDLRTALNKVAEIAKQRQSKAGTNVNIDTGAKSNSMKFPKLSKLISGEAWNKVLGIFASEDDQKALEPIETKLATIEADNERPHQGGYGERHEDIFSRNKSYRAERHG
ncbi:MAG: S49 family peptidase [Bacteroidota bacterium]